MSSARLSSLATLVAICLSSPLASADVLIVDQTGNPGTFGLLSDAVSAAVDGDIILVQDAFQPSDATINGKSLTIIGDPAPGGSAQGIENLTIRNLAADQSVVIREMTVSGDLLTSATPASLFSNDGSVAFEGCSFVQPFAASANSSPSLIITNCAGVMLTRCTVVGLTGIGGVFEPGTPGGIGIRASGAALGLYDCDIRGGPGTDANDDFFFEVGATAGGIALDLSSVQLLASGSTIAGGDGGAGLVASTCLFNESGGTGMEATSSLIQLIETTVTGGTAGAPNGCTPTGVDGADFDLTTSSLTTRPEPARHLAATAVVREGDDATIDIEGEGGELTLLLIGFDVFVSPFSSLGGVLLPLALVSVPFTMPAGGTLPLVLTIAPGTLPVGVDGFSMHLQTVAAGILSTGVLGSPSSLTIVDASF